MSNKRSLYSVLKELFKPFLRFALHRGLRFQEISELVKDGLIEVASDELESKDQEVNLSRLSVLTGLQRKDIKRLNTGKKDSSTNVNLLSRVLGQWQGYPDYQDKEGKPKELTVEGGGSEFSQLVRSISVDLNPYTVLFALEQAGMVERVEDKVLLLSEVYQPGPSVANGIDLLAQDTSTLLSAVEKNIFEDHQIPNLHITTSYDNICAEDLDAVRSWLLDQGTTLHEKAREYLAKRDKDTNPRLYKKEGGGRVMLCTFSLIEGGGAK